MKLPRNALPSASFGYMPATTLFVFMRSHIGKKQPLNSFRPKKNMVVKLKPWPGLPPRPKNHDSHGTIVATHGTPFASHTSATGFVTSGVEEQRTMSTLLLKISSRATCDARLGSDCVSLTTISTS